MELRNALFVVAIGLLSGPVSAQSINIDFGPPGAGPPSNYGAAGLPGVWNSIEGENTPFQDPQIIYDLVGLDGQPTNVTLYQFGGTELLTGSDPSVSGNDATLLNDCILTHTQSLETCLFIHGLQNGTYEAITYAWRPDHPEVDSVVRYDFQTMTAPVGGAWPGQHVEGVTYAVHIIEVTNGYIGGHSGNAPGGNLEIGAALNGLQLRFLDSECQGDGDCNDGITCTVDSCNLTTQTCVNVPNHSLCNDGIGCTADSCSVTQGCVHQPNNGSCNDGVSCTVDTCQVGVGCVNSPNDASCSNGTFCDGVETCDVELGCQPGTDPCVSPPLTLCNEAFDFCAECLSDDDCGSGRPFCDVFCLECLSDADCADGVYCNGQETCDFSGTCRSSQGGPCGDLDFPICDEANEECDQCASSDDCPAGLFCDAQGSCVECETNEDCSDGNPCTDDGCVVGTGCVHTTNGNPCDDGDACTQDDACSEGSCAPGPAVSCDNGLFCDGEETCDPLAGCQPGDPPCAVDEVCDEASASCIPVNSCTSNADCVDGLPCTFDTCEDSVCSNAPAIYGDIAGPGGTCGPDGQVSLFDILMVLDAFQDVYAEGCEVENVDLAGFGGTCKVDASIDLFDIFKVLDAFLGADPCCSNPP